MSGDLSIVIPCYNHQTELKSALASIEALHTRPFVVVVVDDGSLEPVQLNRSDYSFPVELIRQSNSGLPATRNKGLELVDTQWICFLDADDDLYPDAFDFLKGLGSNDATDVYCMAYDVVQDGVVSAVYPRYGKPTDALLQCNLGPPHSYVFKTKTIQSLGGFNTQELRSGGHEDYDLVCRIAANDGVFAYRFEKVGIYHKYQGSMSTDVTKMARTRVYVWSRYFLSIDNKELTLSGLANALAFLDRHYDDFVEYEYEQLDPIVKKLSDLVGASLFNSQEIDYLIQHLPLELKATLVKPSAKENHAAKLHPIATKSYDWKGQAFYPALAFHRLEKAFKFANKTRVNSVYLWGANDVAESVYPMLQALAPVVIVDSNVKSAPWYNGKVIHPNDIVELDSRLFYIASHNYFDEIKQNVLAIGGDANWVF